MNSIIRHVNDYGFLFNKGAGGKRWRFCDVIASTDQFKIWQWFGNGLWHVIRVSYRCCCRLPFCRCMPLIATLRAASCR